MGHRLLLLDEGFMSGAITAVGLRDAGFHVTVVAASGGKANYTGRDLTWRLAPPVASAGYAAMLDALALGGQFDYVLPLTEPIQARIWDRESSRAWSGRAYPRTEQWQRALLRDKREMSDFVARSGVTVPTQYPLRSEVDVARAVEALGLPVVVKGVRGRGGHATRIATSLTDAIAAMRAIQAAGIACIAQRHVAGATFLVGGVFREGCALRAYAGEKLAQYPPRTGPGIRFRSLRDPALTDAALKVMRELRLSGIASMDFVRDAQGRYHFLEVNPRPWGSMHAAHDAGVDLFGALGSLLRGERIEPELSFREGVESWIFPLCLLSRGGWLGLGAGARELRELWWPLGQGRHIAHRLLRVAKNWRGA